MTMTVHNYRPGQFQRTSNGENQSSGYRDIGSASLAAGCPIGPWWQYISSLEGWGVKMGRSPKRQVILDTDTDVGQCPHSPCTQHDQRVIKQPTIIYNTFIAILYMARKQQRSNINCTAQKNRMITHKRHGWAMMCRYCQVSNIRRTKYLHLKDSRAVLRLSLPNPLKPDVKSRMKM